ncbi:MAG TPA: histidine triad nucleotide-binding protein [Spirochaetia bacterium]|nr:histidine triad nucleotide-binding protein [Spirochaetia bacterium]
MPEKTIFEKIRDKEIKSEIVFEDDVAIAFKDVNPQAPVHVLVIPQQKLTGFPELKNADPSFAGAFIARVARVAGELGLEKDGYRIVFNSGKNGQQSVDYLHAHIIGGRQMGWPPG